MALLGGGSKGLLSGGAGDADGPCWALVLVREICCGRSRTGRQGSRALRRKRGGGSSENAELEAGLRLKIVTSQLFCILSTVTCHDLRLPFHTPCRKTQS